MGMVFWGENILEEKPEFGPVFGTKPRGRLLSAAANLFSKNGINATGIDCVIKEAGTAKTTLYTAFGSKEGLIVAVLEAESQAWLDWFAREVDGVNGSSRDKLAATFDVLHKWFSHEQFYGCPLFNAMAESPSSSYKIRELAFNHRAVLERRFKILAIDCGVKNADRLVRELMILLDGAIISACIRRDPNAATSAATAFATILHKEVNTIRPNCEAESMSFVKMAVE